MAGRIKHMERSRKTRNKNYSEFNSFKRQAFLREQRSERKTSVAEMIKNLFKRNKDK